MTIKRPTNVISCGSLNFADGDTLEVGLISETLDNTYAFLAIWHPAKPSTPDERLATSVFHRYDTLPHALEDFNSTMEYYGELLLEDEK